MNKPTFSRRPQDVWVLLGGSSSEREVSLKTGRGVEEALRQKGFKVSAFDVRAGREMLELNWAQPPDIVFIALHGPFGEDGTIQGFLDSIRVPYVGSGVGSSALCMHKALAKKYLMSLGVSCPAGFELNGPGDLAAFMRREALAPGFFQKKYFIKPSREGSTIGIERYSGDGGAADFQILCEKAMSFDGCVLIEEWVEGPELTIPLLQGQALPIVEIRPLAKFYNYESKYTVGKTEYLCPAPLPASETERCQRLAEKAFAVLECRDYGRVDIMLGKDGPKVLEMNTLPGMTGTSLVPKSAAAAGMDYATFVEVLVCTSFERQLRR